MGLRRNAACNRPISRVTPPCRPLFVCPAEVPIEVIGDRGTAADGDTLAAGAVRGAGAGGVRGAAAGGVRGAGAGGVRGAAAGGVRGAGAGSSITKVRGTAAPALAGVAGAVL